MSTAHINIGSNLGDSRSIIERAVAEIALLPDTERPLRRSDYITSDPWGFTSAHRFLNIGVEIHTGIRPEELLRRLLSIQDSISPAPHRTADGSGYADRMIDIDLIYYGNTICSTPTLTLPHPRLHLREFVLRPILQLSPGWVHPILHQTPAEMLAELGMHIAVRHIAPASPMN